MQFEAHANIRRGHRHPVRHRMPVGPNLSLHLPRPDRLVIVADGPQAEDSDGAACPPTRAARHRDDAVDSKEGGELDRALQCALCLGAGAGVRVEWIAGRIHGAECDAGVVEVALKLVACRGVAQQRRKVQVRPGAPRPDAHLGVGDVVFSRPRKGIAPRQVLESVGEEPDPHERLLWSVVPRLVLRRRAGAGSRQAGSRRAAQRGRPVPPRPRRAPGLLS